MHGEAKDVAGRPDLRRWYSDVMLGARDGGCAGPSRLSVTVIEAFEMSGKGCLLNLASTTAPDRVKSAFWTFGNGR